MSSNKQHATQLSDQEQPTRHKGRNGQSADRKPKPVRKVSPKYLRRAGLFYLERYSATRQSLRQVLMRRVYKHLRAYGGDQAEMAEWVEETVTEFVTLGYVDDRTFAFSRSRSLLAGGHSLRSISQKLAQKGIDKSDIDHALERLREEAGGEDEQAAMEEKAAWTYARKRRFGPYRDPAKREERRDRDLAALMRRGFNFELAQTIIDYPDDPTQRD